jgi:sigma-B regulation protein RsbU (phosphoserine phosphatase)
MLTETATTPTISSKITVMIAGDNPTVSLLLSVTLTKWGYRVARASDGRDALAQLMNQEIGILISDYDMPGLDGIELCREIRGRKWPGYIYVLLCTAKDNKDDLIRAMEAGADDFVSKPIDFAELRVRLRAAQRVIDLQHELESQNRELRKAYNTLDRDLRAAARLQQNLLPQKALAGPELGIDWLFLPSLYLAGDMFNFMQLDQDNIGIYQLDVSGHGIPAALLSIALSRVLTKESGGLLNRESADAANRIRPPSEVVFRLNERFHSDDDSYFTLLYGIFNRMSRSFRFCQAGHPSPILLQCGATARSVGSGGFPVGMMPSMDWEEESITLAPGDRLVLYSDGVTEAKSASGQQFSEEGLLNSLSGGSQSGLHGMLDRLHDDVRTWCGKDEYADDISVLAMEAH